MRVSVSMILSYCSLLTAIAGVTAQIYGNQKIDNDPVGRDCHICGDTGDDGLRQDKPYCLELSTEIEDSDRLEDSADCFALQYTWSGTCRQEKVALSNHLPRNGTFPKCELCPSLLELEYPRNTTHVTFLSLGIGSCAEWWEAGQLGQIPPHVCEPLQLFA